MKNSIPEIPDPSQRIAVADWIEYYIATTGNFISKAEISHHLESATGQEPSEAFVCDVWRELEEREKLYYESPFLVDELAIEPKEDYSNNVYLVCLMISLYRDCLETPAKLFERITCVALKQYLDGEAKVIGWPIEEDDVSIPIKDRVREISIWTNEKFATYPDSKYKDRGVDVIAWKPFDDKRSSQTVVLSQCATGKKWRLKTTELPIESWNQYIHWACNPTKAFSVPHIIPNTDWHDVSKEGGILFDRIRISNLTCDISKQDKSLARDINDFIVTNITNIAG